MRARMNGKPFSLYACGKQVIIEMIVPGESKEGGIIVPGTSLSAKAKVMHKVVAVGPQAVEAAGVDLQIGDYVQFAHAPHQGILNLAVFQVDGKEYGCVPADAILVVFKKDEKPN